MTDEFRVEVELDDSEHGYSLGERLRAVDLDEDARERLGTGVMVTRDGSRLFAYASSEEEARPAERAIRELVAEDGLKAELAALEATEAREAAAEGRYDWEVVVRMPSRDAARALAKRLTEDGVPVRRRWRYVAAGAASEERAEEIAAQLRDELPDADVEIDVDLSDVTRSPLQFLPF